MWWVTRYVLSTVPKSPSNYQYLGNWEFLFHSQGMASRRRQVDCRKLIWSWFPARMLSSMVTMQPTPNIRQLHMVMGNDSVMEASVNEVSAPSFRGLGKLMPVSQTDFLTSILFWEESRKPVWRALVCLPNPLNDEYDVTRLPHLQNITSKYSLVQRLV